MGKIFFPSKFTIHLMYLQIELADEICITTKPTTMKKRLSVRFFFLYCIWFFDNAFIFHVFRHELCFIRFLKKNGCCVVAFGSSRRSSEFQHCLRSNASHGCDSWKCQWQTHPYVVQRISCASSSFRPHEQSNQWKMCVFWIVDWIWGLVLKKITL